MGGVRRAVDLGHLEVHVPVEPVEQSFARTEDHRSRRDDQLVDLSRRQCLSDDVGAATDCDVSVAGGRGRLGEGRIDVRDEPEPGFGRRLDCPTMVKAEGASPGLGRMASGWGLT